jgi:ribosome-interacting GTPase 1
MEEVNMIAEQPNTVVISCNMKLNFDGLLEKIWEHLDLVRVYTKKANENPDFGDPIVLTNDRNGCSVKSVCEQIHRDLPKEFKYAKVWGKSCKFIPQKVGLAHILMDEDVIQIYKNKTKAQIKKEKIGADTPADPKKTDKTKKKK